MLNLQQPRCAPLENWSQQHGLIEKLRASRPEIPNQLDDRKADICEPLLVIADAAGEDWPQRSARP